MLAYTMEGQGPAVVFLHGFAGSAGQWTTYKAAVADAGFTGFAVDLPAHGRSPLPPGRPASTLEWGETVFRWLDTHPTAPFHLVGHSLGGYLALAYVLRHPERVASLVLFAPLLAADALRKRIRWAVQWGNRWPWLPPTWPPGFAWLVRGLLWLYPEAWHMRPSQRARRVREIVRMSPRAVWALRHIPDLRPQLSALTAATWVIGGARDSILYPASYAALARFVPHARVHLLPHAGHIPHLTEAVSLRAALVDWLRAHSAAS